MDSQAKDEFRGYLDSIPDELLLAVTDDCAWLAETFAGEPVCGEYRSRTAACLDEEQRRGWPQPGRRPAPIHRQMPAGSDRSSRTVRRSASMKTVGPTSAIAG